MTAGGRSPNAVSTGRAAEPGRPELRGRAGPGRRARPAFDRQWRIAGLPVARARARLRRRLASWSVERRERPVGVEPGLADGQRRADRRPSRTIRSQPAVVDRRPPRGDGPRPRRRARRTGRPGRGRRPTIGVPARDEDPLDPGQPRAADRRGRRPRAKRSAWRCPWLSTRRNGRRASPSRRLRPLGRPRSRGAGTADAGAVSVPGLARVGAPAELVEERRTAVAVGSVGVGVAELGEHPRRRPGHERGRPPDAISRHASTRSPRTAPSRRPAPSSPALAALARTHGCSASTSLFAAADEVPQHRPAPRGGGSASRRSRYPARGRPPSAPPSDESGPPARGRPGAVEVAAGHRHRPVDEVAEVVGEIGVVAPDERVPAHVGVTVERDLAQRDVPGAVGPERRDDRVRVDEVAAALAHLLAAGREQPAVDPDPARRLEAGAPQHGRPVDRVEPGDVLADHVEVGRPPPGERVRVVGEAGPGDVVDQRVVPDVDRAGLRVPAAVLALRRSRRSRRSGTGSPSRRRRG